MVRHEGQKAALFQAELGLYGSGIVWKWAASVEAQRPYIRAKLLVNLFICERKPKLARPRVRLFGSGYSCSELACAVGVPKWFGVGHSVYLVE
jgi:hypothetical protein